MEDSSSEGGINREHLSSAEAADPSGPEGREIEWPKPREDPDEEPNEPWARAGQHSGREWDGWGRWRDES